MVGILESVNDVDGKNLTTSHIEKQGGIKLVEINLELGFILHDRELAVTQLLSCHHQLFSPSCDDELRKTIPKSKKSLG